MLVSVSVLNEYDRLINAVKKVNESNADYLHIDVMDGIFVENKKFPLEVVRDVISISKKPLDVHLMVDSIDTVKEYALLKPKYLTFHVEILEGYDIIDYVKSLGIKVGLAINPKTDIQKIISYIDDIDLILFMSVEPGLGGQEFITEVIEKIKRVKEIAPEDLIISVDGGVNNKTVGLCKYAGCNMVVSGSYITNSDNYNNKINELK